MVYSNFKVKVLLLTGQSQSFTTNRRSHIFINFLMDIYFQLQVMVTMFEISQIALVI